MNVLRDDLVSPEISLLDKTRIRAQVPRIGTPRAAAGVRKRQGRHDRETGLARLSRQLFAVLGEGIEQLKAQMGDRAER
jgi:hypothetical protein